MKDVKADLVVSNEMQNLAVVRDFLLKTLDKGEVPSKPARLITLAVDEAVSNIIRHAYVDFSRGTRTIDITVSVRNVCVEITLRDSGRDFDPSGQDAPDLQRHVEERRRHGLGLFLIRKVMDEVEYVFRAGVENVLRMVKYVDGE